MKIYGECICTSLGNNFKLGSLYGIIINEIRNTFTIPESTSPQFEYMLDDLPKYFKKVLTKNEFVSLMKTNLGITDEDIVEFRSSELDTDIICMKYKHDLMYIILQSEINNTDITVDIEITSNNLARQKSFSIELFEEDINKFCNLLKLMHK